MNDMYKYSQKQGEYRKDIPTNELLSKCNIKFGDCYDSNGKKVPGLIWKSFDESKKSFNFHIVPENREFDSKKAIDIGKAIKQKLDNLQFEFKMSKNLSQGSKTWTKGHKYLCITFKDYEYILGYQSLICSNATPKVIDCYLDCIQFMRYCEKEDGPNYLDEKDDLVILYPENIKNKSQKADQKGHIVINSGLNLNINSHEEIADEFIKFIVSTV